MDAANIDLKGFTEHFYKSLCSAQLAPVLDTLAYLKQETNVWFEITTLLIPRERLTRRDRSAQLLGDGAARARRSAPFHGLSSRLEDAGQACDAGVNAWLGTAYRSGCGTLARVHRKHPRRRGAEHILSFL